MVNREPDSQPSARELAETIDLIREPGCHGSFAEPQYATSAADIIAMETGIQVYTLTQFLLDQVTRTPILTRWNRI